VSGPKQESLKRPAAKIEDGQRAYQLFIMRHGIALDRASPLASDDTMRPLTPKGRKRMARIAEELHKLGYAFDWIVSSPLVRAAETAEIVAASQKPKPPVDVCAALTPGAPREDVLAFLAKNPDRKRVMLVGHEPDLSALAGRLIGAGRDANLEFKKGGCCLIEYDGLPARYAGRLVWWLTPRALRANK
jgi:phosphohistidine phosphatase